MKAQWAIQFSFLEEAERAVSQCVNFCKMWWKLSELVGFAFVKLDKR